MGAATVGLEVDEEEAMVEVAKRVLAKAVKEVESAAPDSPHRYLAAPVRNNSFGRSAKWGPPMTVRLEVHGRKKRP